MRCFSPPRSSRVLAEGWSTWGRGRGVVGLRARAGGPAARVPLVERGRALVACVEPSLALTQNRAFADRVTVAAADVRDGIAGSGAAKGSADAVIMNPPFYDAGAGTQP